MEIICKICSFNKLNYAKGLCKECYGKNYYKNHLNYQNDYNHKNNLHQPMNENKSCASYLGCHIAEQVLSKVFKNVEVMTNCNKGYDFKCNNGFLIDVKSSCISKGKYNNWHFTIKQNKIPDYFLLLAFDNRENLNPLHIWLIKGSLINNKNSFGISESTISKWDEYKLDINKVIKCCDTLRL